MIYLTHILIAFFIAFVSSILLTFPIRKLAIKWGMLDYPNKRKIHTEVKPRFGGIAIFLGALLGGIYLQPSHEHLTEISLGVIIIIVTGTLDDRYHIRPGIKLAGQLIAASFLVSSGLIIEKITIPIFGVIDLGFMSVLVTVLWVVGITNAINLLDGLDGLATGVSTIALLSMFVMALIDAQIIPAYLSIVLIGANLGFLYHNFYPAKIYMGDTGSNFLGFMIATISMLGLFKNVALFSFIIPVIILALPIFDTLFVIIHRFLRNESIMMPDNKHIHYQLVRAGFSHRQTVLIMYGFSLLFGGLAILFSKGSFLLSLVITVIVICLLYMLAELTGLVGNGRRPLLDLLKAFFQKERRYDRD